MFIDKRTINQWSCVATVPNDAGAMQLTDFCNNSDHKQIDTPQ